MSIHRFIEIDGKRHFWRDILQLRREDLWPSLALLSFTLTSNFTRKPVRTRPPYIATWLEVLKNASRAIFEAAAHAQRAADYLHGLQKPKAEAA